MRPCSRFDDAQLHKSLYSVAQHGKSPEGERTQLLANLLYETALLESGFQLTDNKAFNKRVYSLVKVSLAMDCGVQIPLLSCEPARLLHSQWHTSRLRFSRSFSQSQSNEISRGDATGCAEDQGRLRQVRGAGGAC